MSAVRLGPGREFDLIREILAGDLAGPSLEVGPGDDAAVLARPARIVTTDMSVEGVHFRREWLTAREVGYRAVMAAVSDLAAMGAQAVAVLVSLAGSGEDARTGYLTEVGRGTRDAAGDVGAALAGGDVTRSPGPLVVDVVALGEAERPVLRSGARPGDQVWVSGLLGGAAAAVRLWESGRGVPDSLRHRFARPSPRLAAMDRLREAGLVTAGMDLSDGLLQDGGHLAAASGVGLDLLVERIPVDPAAVAALGADAALEAAVSGGEDYELLVTAPDGTEARIREIAGTAGVEMTLVGVVREGSAVRLLDLDGRPVETGRSGFDHFAPDGGS